MLTEAVALGIIGAVTTIIGYMFSGSKQKREESLRRDRLSNDVIIQTNMELRERITELQARSKSLEEQREKWFESYEKEKRKSRHEILLLRQELAIYRVSCSGCQAKKFIKGLPSVEDLRDEGPESYSLSEIIESVSSNEKKILQFEERVEGKSVKADRVSKGSIETDEELCKAFGSCERGDSQDNEE